MILWWSKGSFLPTWPGLKGYIAPEVLSTLHLALTDPQRKFPNARTDLHALAVLFYQYLLLRHPLDGRRIPNADSAEAQEVLSYGKEALFCEHPTNTANRPDANAFIPYSSLGPAMVDLFQRAFVGGLHVPPNRPSALEWLRGLVKTWDLLWPCPAGCPRKFSPIADPKLPRCGFCGAAARTPVPLLRLRRERGAGQWLVDGQLCVYHNLSLFKWHAFSDVYPGPDADRTPQAYFAWHEGQWLLINQRLDSLTTPAGNRCRPARRSSCDHGETIRLGSRGPADAA